MHQSKCIGTEGRRELTHRQTRKAELPILRPPTRLQPESLDTWSLAGMLSVHAMFSKRALRCVRTTIQVAVSVQGHRASSAGAVRRPGFWVTCIGAVELSSLMQHAAPIIPGPPRLIEYVCHAFYFYFFNNTRDAQVLGGPTRRSM